MIRAISRRLATYRLIEVKRGLSCAKTYQQYRSAEAYPTLKPFDEHQCIFVHIPKTGGMAVVKALFGNHLMKGHRGCQFYRCVYGPDYRRYFKFAFVRNPWDRVASAYNFLEQGGVNASDKAFGEFITKKYNGFKPFVMDWLNRTNAYAWTHFIPQYEYVCNLRGAIDIDYVGRMETLPDDFEVIRNKLDIQDARLERINASKRSADYRTFYDDATAKRVAQVYKRDIKLFDYSF